MRSLATFVLLLVVQLARATVLEEDLELVAQAEEYHGGDDNTMHDGHGKFQFPRDPVQTKFKDAVIYVQYGDSSNQSVSGFRTAIDGIFQNSDGSTSLGWQKSPKIDDDEQVDWEKLLTDKPASDCQKVSYHKYGKSDSAKACKTKHPSIYQDSNGATTLSWILCNSTQVDICGLKNSTSSNSSTGSSNQSNNNNNGNTNVNNGNNNNNNSNGNSNSGSNNGSGSDNGSGSSSSSQIYYPPNFSQDDDANPETNFTADGNEGLYKVHKGGKISSTEFQMTFEVLGKGGAGIAFKMSKNQTDANAIEIVIGDQADTRVLVRIGTGSQGRVIATANIPNLLSATQPKAFWVQLDHNMLSMGQGHNFGSLTLVPLTQVPTIGSRGWLWIGWAGFKTQVTYTYKGATVSCLNVVPSWKPTPTPTVPPRPPPINCKVSDYVIPNATVLSASCSTSCGGGTYVVNRNILIEPANGGAPCPELSLTLPCNQQPCPPKCNVGEWSAWSTCTKKCGGGKQTSTRSITINANAPYSSEECPTETTKEQDCNTKCCPVDCEVSNFGPWGQCSTSCGGGIQTRSSVVITPPSCGGRACPYLVEQQPCNTDRCVCQVSDWSEFTPCSAKCGGGTQTATRTITGTGYGCPDPSDTIMTQSCNTQACPIDCVVGNWHNVTDCSSPCGTGFQTIQRDIIIMNQNGGSPCPYLTDSIPCNTQACPPVCQADPWSEWSTCSKTCGGGTQYQTRTSAVDFYVSGNGGKYKRFGLSMLKADSFAFKFSVECTSDVMVAFLPSQSESSSKALEVVLGGNNNSVSMIRFGTGSDGKVLKSVDGTVCNPQASQKQSFWIALAEGTLSVGNGLDGTSNVIMTASIGDDLTASQLYVGFSGISTINHYMLYEDGCQMVHRQTRQCNTGCCPIDCQVTAWSKPSDCDASCGGGSSWSYRSIAVYDDCGGLSCDSLPLRKRYDCNTQSCPYCKISEWTWSDCSESCGPNGVQTGWRTVKEIGGHPDVPCPSKVNDTRTCNTDIICPVDCKVSNWLTPTIPTPTTYRLSNTDGEYKTYLPNQIQNGEFVYAFQAMCYGDMHMVLSETDDATPKDAYEIVFGGKDNTVSSIRYGAGNEDLNASITIRKDICNPTTLQAFWVKYHDSELSVGMDVYSESNPPFMSVRVPKLKPEKLYVGFTSIAHDLIIKVARANVTSSQGWGECSQPCGGGKQYRYRNIVVPAYGGGAACPPLVEQRSCNDDPCPQCIYSSWSDWSACSASCGNGIQTKIRSVVLSPDLNCPDSTFESQPCNVACCPTNCKISDYSEWSECDTVCGGGWQTKYANIIANASCGGQSCPPLTKQQSCNEQACSPCCLTSQWSEWSACSATCGQGTQYRTRDVGQSSAANCNGYTCPTNAFQERTCQITPCKIDCKVSEWSSFSTCSLECGGGTQIQTRSILIKAEYGGKACPTDLINVQPCNTDDCPTQCTTGPWGNWSACSKTCNDGTGSGTQYRMRQMGRIATADIFLQSACDTQLVRNAGSVVVGTDKFRLSSDVDMLYVYSYDVHGVLSVTNSSITADNNQLVAIAQTPAEGVHIIAIHYGSEAGMTALSTMNRNNIVKAGGSMMHLPEDQSALADIAAAQKGGWTYLLVLNQGERAVEERYDGCGTQEFGGDLQVQQVDANGNCPQQATQTQPCNQQYCPVPCTLSNWTEWSTCSTTCGKGTQSASRYVVQAAMYGGQPCDITYKWQYCNDVPCPQPCKVGAWSPVSQCSKTCGGGTMKRYRNITIPDNYNGPPCPSLTEEEFECNTQACPTPPPPPPTCYSSPCTPAPPPPPPPCKKHNLEFDQQPSQGYYQRFDSVKVKATEFDVQFEVKGCSGASVGFLTDTIDMAFKNAYEVQIGAVDGTQGGIYWGTQSGTPLVTAQHEYLPQPCDQFQAFWITLRQGVMSVGSGSEFGSNKIMSATVPKIVGDGCDCLFVGFAASTEMLTYRYSPPLKSCLADMCASLSSPSAPGDGDHGDGNHNGDGDHGDGDHGDGNHNGDGDHGDGNHSGDGDHGNHNT